MNGIIEVGTGKIFAKKGSLWELNLLMKKMEVAYPNKKFIVGQVDSDARPVGYFKKGKVKKE